MYKEVHMSKLTKEKFDEVMATKGEVSFVYDNGEIQVKMSGQEAVIYAGICEIIKRFAETTNTTVFELLSSMETGYKLLDMFQAQKEEKN